MTQFPDGPQAEAILDNIRAHKGRFTTLGIVLIVLGVLAIMFPLFSSITAKVLIGWLLLLSGAMMLYAAFQARSWESAIWAGLIGLLQLAAGVYLAFFPLTGLLGLTFLVGVLFLVQGAFEFAIALRHRPRRGWGWLVASGIASVLLGLMLIVGLPGTAFWALGLLFGINLISSGVSFVALARTV